MSRDCGECPRLRAEVARLAGEVRSRDNTIRALRELLRAVRAQVAATRTFIEREHTDPTMPRKRLLPTVCARLGAAVETADGR